MGQWRCFCIANFSMAFGESEDIFIDEVSEEILKIHTVTTKGTSWGRGQILVIYFLTFEISLLLKSRAVMSQG